jgi:hypothetical protein
MTILAASPFRYPVITADQMVNFGLAHGYFQADNISKCL